jgi:uncharacterized integral membrane protein
VELVAALCKSFGEAARRVQSPPMETRPVTEERKGMTRSVRLWAIVIAVLLLVIFIAENSQEVEVRFLFVETQTPLIFGLLVAGILGFLIGWLAPIVRRGRREHD